MAAFLPKDWETDWMYFYRRPSSKKSFRGRRGSEDSSEHLSCSLKILEEDVEFARKHHPGDIGSAPVPEEFRSFVAVPEEFRSFVATFRQNVELLIMHDFRVIRQDDKLQYLQDYKRMSRKMMLG